MGNRTRMSYVLRTYFSYYCMFVTGDADLRFHHFIEQCNRFALTTMALGHFLRRNTATKNHTTTPLLILLAFATTAASGFQNTSFQPPQTTRNTKIRSNNRLAEICEMSTSNDRCGIDYPKLVVFDLDACFWDQEMYEMPALPSKTVTGALNDAGEGVTGAYSGRHKISMYPGSLVALQEHAAGTKYPGMKVCFASSADTPFAEKIGRATLKLLEVVPGLTVWDLVLKDWDGEDVNQIGRQPPLSSNKAQTHFPRIRKITGIPYNKMLFFDDCNWGDHVGMVSRGCKEDNGEGVVGHRTPRGLTIADWYKGLELYKKQAQQSSS